VLRPHARRAADLALGGALAGVAFGAAGGSELSRTTIVEVLAVLLCGTIVAIAVVWSRPGRIHGATSVALFGALAFLTALSITWAIVPSLAYVEAGRTFAYLAIFAAAVAAARLAPRATATVITGIVLAATAAVVYSLAARVWPASIGETEISNRIGQPFQYWNAVGSTAALAVPGLLWLGTRRNGVVARVLAYPALGAAILALLLTQSRGALAAAVIGTLAWLAIVPMRLRTLPVIVLPAIAAGAVGAWALSKDAFSVAAEPLSVKESVAGEFGLLLVLMTLALLVAGLVVNAGITRDLPPLHLRRRIGIVALVIAVAVPLVAFTSVAFSDRGLGGTIGDRVDELTSETQTSPSDQGAGRLTAASSTRGKYWREAGHVFDDRPVVGVGAGNFQNGRLRYRSDDSMTRHAHGFVPQTLADLGILGVVLTTALLIAWLIAAARVTGLHPGRLPRRDWDGDRVGLVALTLIAVVFGLQSAIDWTWFVPGPTAMALVAAGFVAGRPPLGQPEAAPALVPATPPRLLAGAGVLLAAILMAWAIWQPEASDRQTADALALADAGNLDAAIVKTRDAADTNPLSSDPLLTRASIETTAGRIGEAGQTLEDAVLKFPGDPQTWYRLATFQLGTLDHPREALETVQGAIFLDPQSKLYRALYLQAAARTRELAAR
jgi:O-antigen ligase/polysaccharide polymerase Wzy-like membrane protein